MTAFLEGITFWHWLVLGGVLITIEVLASAIYFLWLGISALAVGVVLWVFPGMAWEYQVIAFAVLAIASVVLVRQYMAAHPALTDEPNLNRRGHQYVGQTFTLEDAVVNGRGKIRVDDSTWKLVCEDCEPGSRIVVTGVDGAVLHGERVD